MTEGDGKAANSRKAALRIQAGELLAGLRDFDFREMLTPRVIPSLYLLAIGLAGVLSVYLVALGFRDSWLMGAAWLFVLGPTLFVTLVVAARITLELLVSIFHLALHVEEVTKAAGRIEGQTEDIRSDLPRIQFWRSWTRK